jgi:hypothetical protein
MTIEDAKQVAHGLIQGYIDPDDRLMDMPSFYGPPVVWAMSIAFYFIRLKKNGRAIVASPLQAVLVSRAHSGAILSRMRPALFYVALT